VRVAGEVERSYKSASQRVGQKVNQQVSES
jgi:hypothetical protein